MSRWSHNLCERCWFLSDQGVNQDGSFRLPNQILNPDGGPPMDFCCACGVPTITGIYTRRDPAELLCKGDHDHPDRWSPVITALPAPPAGEGL